MKEDKKNKEKLINDVTLNPQDLIDPVSKLVVFNYEETPITEIVNAIIVDAIRMKASDIHFDPMETGLKIRIRIDGALQDYSIVPLYVEKNIVTRIKIISGMNITESRIPQDGAIKNSLDNIDVDLRVSCLPTNLGEKIVIRILDYKMSAAGIEELDFSEENLAKVKRMIEIPNGIILVTGATGTGKSTTVYSILQKLNTEDSNIITVEDPIEMNIEGINQVQVNSDVGLTFATALRSILRQDPDIIMIGEIRDSETAKIAVRASITGHKVLSTIHTNSALNTIERLTDMDVERYLIGTSLNGVISQKLARKLCPYCRKTRKTSEYEKGLFKRILHQDVDEIYDVNPEGCEHCFKGYKNRIAIAEVLFINDEIREAITNAEPKEVMRKLVYGKGQTHTLLQDGLEKVALGETSWDEVIKLVDLENDLAIHRAIEAELEEEIEASLKDKDKFPTEDELVEKLKNQQPVSNEDEVDMELLKQFESEEAGQAPTTPTPTQTENTQPTEETNDNSINFAERSDNIIEQIDI